MGVTGLGDRPLRAGGAGGILGGDQPDERGDGVAGEAVPVSELDGEREPVKWHPAKAASRRTRGVNSLSRGQSTIALSSRFVGRHAGGVVVGLERQLGVSWSKPAAR